MPHADRCSHTDVWVVDTSNSRQKIKVGLKVNAAHERGGMKMAKVVKVNRPTKGKVSCTVQFNHDGGRKDGLTDEELALRWHGEWTLNYMQCVTRKNGSYYAKGEGLDRYITAHEIWKLSGFPRVMNEVAVDVGLTQSAMSLLAGGCISDWSAELLVCAVVKMFPSVMRTA